MHILLLISENMVINGYKQGSNQGVGGCSPAVPPSKPPQNRNLKDTDFVDMMLSKILRDLPISRNQPLKLADDWYIRILENKLIKLKKNKKIGHCIELWKM
jgi:hypothetical protein